MSTRYRFDGAKYRAERERQGERRENLAVRLGCSYALIAAVENGVHSNPSAAKAKWLAAGLDRPVDDFMVPVEEPVLA
jgi:transcriptional regulator with XRE-family HTH domain